MANGQISNIAPPNVATVVLSVLVPFPVKAAAVIALGDYVMFDTGGYLIPAGDTAAATFCGQAAQAITGGATDGAVSALVTPVALLRQNWCKIGAVSPAIATWVGKLVYFNGPQVAALAATTTNDVVFGLCTSVTTTGTSGVITVDSGRTN